MKNNKILNLVLAGSISLLALNPLQAQQESPKVLSAHPRTETVTKEADHHLADRPTHYNVDKLVRNEIAGSEFKCPPYKDKDICVTAVKRKLEACLEGVSSMGNHEASRIECQKRALARELNCTQSCKK